MSSGGLFQTVGDVIYILHNHELTVFIHSHIIVHCSCISSLLVLSSLVLHPIETVTVFFSHSLMQVSAESPQSLRVRNLLLGVYSTIQIVLSSHALKPAFSSSAGLPISNHSNIITTYTMKAALCANIILFVDISYYVCSLESITPPVKLHVMTLNALVIVQESCRTNFATTDLVFDSIFADGSDSAQHIACRFDYWKILLCRMFALGV